MKGGRTIGNEFLCDRDENAKHSSALPCTAITLEPADTQSLLKTF
jgi:hypothetical protein